MRSTAEKKNPRKPLEEQNKPGRYDHRNRLNDLSGRDWLLLTKSFWTTESSTLDRSAYSHPAPFMVRDVEKLISLFTKRGMLVLDPFVGCGTTLVAANRLGRKAIGIDINKKYKKLARARLSSLNLTDYEFRVGDSKVVLESIPSVDYVVTSPPYYNILRNNSKGTRHYNGKLYRMGAREGVDYYTELRDDLGNLPSYQQFLKSLQEIMTKTYLTLKEGGYCTIIISDFTVSKKEVCVQGDVVALMEEIGFVFCGTTVLIQPVKPLFPFGYPYSYKINHHHHNIITFQKPNVKKLRHLRLSK